MTLGKGKHPVAVPALADLPSREILFMSLSSPSPERQHRCSQPCFLCTVVPWWECFLPIYSFSVALFSPAAENQSSTQLDIPTHAQHSAQLFQCPSGKLLLQCWPEVTHLSSPCLTIRWRTYSLIEGHWCLKSWIHPRKESWTLPIFHLNCIHQNQLCCLRGGDERYCFFVSARCQWKENSLIKKEHFPM